MRFSTACWSASAGRFLQRRGLKPHFFGTYLNIAANVLFWAVLSGVFERQGYGAMVSRSAYRLWRVSRLGPDAPAVCLRRLCRRLRLRGCQLDAHPQRHGLHTSVLAYFVITAIAMLVVLVQIARRFGRPA